MVGRKLFRQVRALPRRFPWLAACAATAGALVRGLSRSFVAICTFADAAVATAAAAAITSTAIAFVVALAAPATIAVAGTTAC